MYKHFEDNRYHYLILELCSHDVLLVIRYADGVDTGSFSKESQVSDRARSPVLSSADHRRCKISAQPVHHPPRSEAGQYLSG